MRVKNWHKFQHFKDRKPPWVKLYRDILDDLEWYELDPEAAKSLVMIWLIASESDGVIPDMKTLSFRLRVTQQKAKSLIDKLSHWLIFDDINVISNGYQSDRPETETETETEHDISRDINDSRFDEFWKNYPHKKAKSAALKAWNKARINGEFESVIASLNSQRDACENLRYFPHAAKWINEKRWEDEIIDSCNEGDLL